MRERLIIAYSFFVWMNVTAQMKDTVKIVAVGDIMMGTSYPDSTFLPKFNSQYLFKPLSQFLKSGDVVFGNLEGTLTDDLSQVKECNTEGRCYFFAMPTSYSKSLKNAGFNVMSLANNHLNDFGYIGRRSTRRSLRSQGIRFAGLLECPVDTFTRGGVRYGFCAFAPNAGTVNIKDMKRAVKLVHYLDSISDVVIVSFHAGVEGVEGQNVTRKREFYIGEDRGNVYEFAHKMIDAGADVLLGHGPHVTRSVELYKRRFITYSMGNFCTYSRVSVAGQCGIAPLFHIYTNRKGEFLKAQIIPTHQKKYQPPRYDEKKRAISIIQNLTRVDFPEMVNVMRIGDDGWIQPLNQGRKILMDKNPELSAKNQYKLTTKKQNTI
ncbi:Capsule synthesis protein, CapA [Paludibacter propionicigenes WB4]|uniref:Capsule synthesis protein, CapA n=1 Tax=Paludibacter propionicigenes (strain DSM 17365 / JCM 13257 / WB4) TaxID=694427 RepID=E4T7X6_PALPW|nr:CapA family protein [Paludibacter propionicigenes]ADQ80820.1 Capsule synthesis protein, CapA [Paludibacter propionicigenes WB4]